LPPKSKNLLNFDANIISNFQNHVNGNGLPCGIVPDQDEFVKSRMETACNQYSSVTWRSAPEHETRWSQFPPLAAALFVKAAQRPFSCSAPEAQFRFHLFGKRQMCQDSRMGKKTYAYFRTAKCDF
jgi:hypothetical protein